MSGFEFNDLTGTPELNESAVANLQCNILRSTNRLRSTQVFHRFGDAKQFATWLRSKSDPSSANDTTDPLVNVFFTAEGLRLLGVSNDDLERMDLAFRRGTRHTRTLEKLKDDHPFNWGSHRASWHAVELCASDSTPTCERPVDHDYALERGAAIGVDGLPLEDPDAPRYGHFRVRDGLSHTVYTEQDYQALPDRSRYWDPRRKLSTLLVPDALSRAPDSYGSYFVFRKYRQDVSAFVAHIHRIADEVVRRFKAPPPKDGEQPGTLRPDQRGFRPFVGVERQEFEALSQMGDLGAIRASKAGKAILTWIFGRGPDGENPIDGTLSNDFNFAARGSSHSCPFHAHIRKSNPRGLTGDEAREYRVSVARRGISYVGTDCGGPTTQQELPGTGLLFWCAQSNIADQFEYIQEKWLNGANSDPDHDPTPDVDTVVGRVAPHVVRSDGETDGSRWERWKNTIDLDCNIWSAVTLEGSEYFYAPSLPGFRTLREIARRLVP